VLVTLLLATAALIGGVITASRLNVEMMPEMNFPVVTTIVAYPGASPEDVADQVTKPVEQAVAGTPGLKRLQSTSADGLSLIVAEFDYGRDTKDAESSIQSAISRVSLPQNAQPPRTARVNLNDLPVVQISLSGQVPLSDLRKIASDTVAPELSKVDGVYGVDLVGGEQQEVKVVVDPQKAADKGISFQQIASMLQANSLALPAGSVDSGDQSIPVRTLHQFGSVDEVEQVVVGVDQKAQAAAVASAQAAAAASALAASAPSGPPSAVLPTGGPAGAAGQQRAAGTPTQGQQAGGASAPAQPAPQSGQHTVESGDTVSQIAQRYGTTVQAIAQANHMSNPDVIHPGDQLVIPQNGAPQSQSGTQQSQPVPGSPGRSTGGPRVSPAPLSEADPPTVKLGDIATVDLVPAPSGGVSRTNGRPSILLLVSKTEGANTVKVATGVTEKLDQLKGRLGSKVELRVVSDESIYVENSLQGLGREGLMGIGFAVMVIFLFLWSPRGTLISAVSIPLSVAIAFLTMYWQGLTLNVMTLAGLAVAVGRVVDDSIVVLENAHRHVAMGEAPAVAARLATAEVAMPVAASTATTVAVFLPLGLVGGLIGQLFRPFAVTVTIALLASLVVALTVVPVLCRLFLSSHQGGGEEAQKPLGRRLLRPNGLFSTRQSPVRGGRSDGLLLRGYSRMLSAALQHRVATLLLMALVLAGSLSLLPRIPVSFLPSDQEKLLTMQIVPPPGASRDAVSRKAADVEQLLGQTSQVTLYQTTLGDDTGSLSSMRAAFSGQGAGAATVMVRLDDSADLAAKAEEIRSAVEEIQGEYRVSVAGQESSGSSKVQLAVSGQDSEAVVRMAENVESALQGTPGLANLSTDRATSAPEIFIQVDPSKAAELGLTTAQLAAAIRGMVAGQTVGRIEQQGGESMELRLTVDPDAVNSPDQLGKLPFGSPKSVPLSDIAQIKQEPRPVQITRVAENPAVNVVADVVEGDTGAVSQEIRRRIAALPVEPGVSVDYGGVLQQLSEGFSSMGRGQLVGVGLVFLVMALFFNSVLDPLVILLSLPLAAIGVLPTLYLTGKTLSMSGMIGMLMLIGIVVTNAIVLLDFARRAIREGRDPRRALMEAGRVRLRPILMTALTTILALMPLALGLEKGSIIAAELATVVIGGLLSSTLLTLVVVPVVYSLVHRRTA
jgi:multidrug efflux pump subunit AcrB